MERSEEPMKLRLEPIVRWAATVLTAAFCALSVVAAPFGCAVGEFEEDRNCSTSVLSWASFAVLAIAVVVSIATRRRPVHWIGMVLTLVVAYAGAVQS